MTDEQLLWVFANISLDNDEKLEDMCDDCRHEVTSGITKCTRCGKPLNKSGDIESFVNENFDIDKYELARNNTVHEDVDDQINKDEDIKDYDVDFMKQLTDE